MIASTYQAVSGSGRDGVEELADELEKHRDHDVRVLAFDGSAFPLDEGVKFPATIAHNVIPIAGSIVDRRLVRDGRGAKAARRESKDLP